MRLTSLNYPQLSIDPQCAQCRSEALSVDELSVLQVVFRAIHS